jgi:hypothetical protein
VDQPQSEPREEYRRRLEARRAAAERLARRHIALGNTRLAAASAVVLLWLALASHLTSLLWLAAPAAAFFVLALVHERVLRARRCCERAAEFYERGLARLDDRWRGAGEGGERFSDPQHPYAEDLDLFGKGSLFELLSTARLQTGEETLARWLLHPAPVAEIVARQAAVEELRPRLDLREDLALLGEEVRSGIRPQSLARWAEQPLVFDSLRLRLAAALLAAGAIGGAVIWAVEGHPTALLVVLIVEAVFFFRVRGGVARIAAAVGEPAYGLELLAQVLARYEREPFRSPRLAALRERLQVGGLAPSHRIARLHRWMELLDSAHHWLMRIVGPPLLYREQIVFAIEAWRKQSGPSVRRWLEAVGEMEALCALAGYAYEHPSDPFPELAPGGPCFEGEGLAHPLLRESRAVRNDVRLCGEPAVLVVSGSNMSGKSTLLRTLGVNAVLAMAGAPVRAGRLRLSPLALGASIRTLDSLHSGTSRFYTEITRIRLLMDLTKGELPVLFLLDELLQGTNSHDRRIGAEAIVRSLAARGAIGLLTTHDLALAHIADVLAPRGANVHFDDHLVDGRMTFDYRLSPGIVRKSNALELMRSVGLEV